ncbi:MAG: LLM class F420-dependent oxidoreductase [Chloroflexaceae bacterium]
MRVGVAFPQTEIGADPVVIRDYAQAVEELGYQYILVADHVLGAGTDTRPDWRGPYTHEHMFHEPFVLLSYLAAITRYVELATGVIILPQRQTALVAKQAAELDVLSGGRLRLGIGVGWNPVEYAALGMDFHTRGARCEEQIALLRELWTRPLVTFAGRWHQVNDAGINPLPVQQPIPLWIGGHAEATLQRVGRMADGWFPLRPPDADTQAMIGRIRAVAQEAGRDPDAIEIEGALSIGQISEDEWIAYATAWRDLGATHLCINTLEAGFTSPQEHIDALEVVREVLESA